MSARPEEALDEHFREEIHQGMLKGLNLVTVLHGSKLEQIGAALGSAIEDFIKGGAALRVACSGALALVAQQGPGGDQGKAKRLEEFLAKGGECERQMDALTDTLIRLIADNLVGQARMEAFVLAGVRQTRGELDEMDSRGQ